MQTPLILHLFGPNVLHHHLGPQKHVNHSMPISMYYFTVGILIFLFLYLLRCKKPASKKRTSSTLKLDSIVLTWFPESNLFL